MTPLYSFAFSLSVILLIASLTNGSSSVVTTSSHPPPLPQNGQGQRELQGSSNVRNTAYAFECTDLDVEIPDPEPHKAGDVVRICVKPEKPTEYRQVVMQSVDEFTFVGNANGYTQPSIKNKREQYYTLSLCIPGQLVCAFKIFLQQELFWSNEGGINEITGAGTVTLQLGDTSQALDGVAGTNIAVKIRIPIETKRPPPGINIEGTCDEDCSWWANTPLWFRIFIIIIAVIILCCICGLLASSCCVLKEIVDEDKERKERRERERERERVREEYADGKYD